MDTITITPWQYRSDSMRVGICGASGLGKSTLARDLAEWMQYPFVAEGYKDYIEKNRIDPTKLDDRGYMKLALELGNQKQALEKAAGFEFISDTTPLDHTAMLLRRLGNKEDFQRGCMDYVKDAMIYSAVTYDIIFMLPFGQFEVEDNGVRSHNMEAKRAMTQMMIESMVFQHGPALLAYQVKALSVEDRVAECINIIDKASQVKAKTYAEAMKKSFDKPESPVQEVTQ